MKSSQSDLVGMPKAISPSSVATKYDCVDALRGFAILGVICVHSFVYSEVRPSGDFFETLFSNASRGVQLFYLVSTLTLFLSQSHRVGKERVAGLNFFIRRFFRIAPMFFVAIILYNMVLQESPVPYFRVITFSFGFFPDTLNRVFPGSWSIAVETSFYLIFPLLFFAIRNFWSALVFLILSVLTAHYTYGEYTNYFFPKVNADLKSEFDFLWIGNQLPVFALGVLLFFTVEGRRPGENRLLGHLVLVLGVFVTIMSFTTSDGYYGYRGDAFFLLKFLHPYMPACFGLFIICIGVFISNSVFLVNPVVVWLGKLSYSFYVLHMFLIIIISRYIAKPINTWVLIAAVIFAGAPICYLTYRLIEIPCIKLGLKVINARKLSKARS